MKKTVLIVLAIVVLALGALGFYLWLENSPNVPPSVVKLAEIDLGESEHFSMAERQAAVDCVIELFKQGYSGSTLKRVYYDEAKSIKEKSSYINYSGYSTYGMDPDNIIVLFLDFHTGRFFQGGFTSDQDYNDWEYILIRDGKDGEWREFSYGY